MFGNLRKDDTHEFKSSSGVLSVLYRIVAVRPLRYFHRRRVRGTIMYMADCLYACYRCWWWCVFKSEAILVPYFPCGKLSLERAPAIDAVQLLNPNGLIGAE